MRSVYVIILNAPVEMIERHLDDRYVRQMDRNWQCQAADHDPVLYVTTPRVSDFDYADQAKLVLPPTEGEPHVVAADVSGRHPGDREVRLFVESLLTAFQGVVFDDYGGPWTLNEIRSGDLKNGHPFFDYRGWYEQDHATH